MLKQKFYLKLLMSLLLVALAVPQVQAQTAQDNYLDLQQYNTIGETPSTTGSSTYYLAKRYIYTTDETEQVAWLNMPVIGAYDAAANGDNGWVSYNNFYLATYATSWSTESPFKGNGTSSNSTYFRSGYSSAATAFGYATNTTTRTISFNVTNCTEVYLSCYLSQNSGNALTYSIVECSVNSDGTLSEVSTVTSGNQTTTSSGIRVWSFQELSASKIYKITASIARGYLTEIAFKMPMSNDVFAASVDKSSIDFGSANQGVDVTRTVTLSNDGRGDADFAPVLSIDGTNADMFKIDPASYEENDELAVGDTRQYGIIFTPTAEGTFTATLTISHPEDKFSPITVTLTGTGNKALYDASVTPDEGQLDFGKIIVGRTATKKVKITSLGSQPIAPTVSITGTGFALNYTTTTLNLNESNEIIVTFTPTAANTIYTGRLTITAYDGKTFNFTLKGEGKDASQATNFDNGTYKWPINASEENQVESSYSEIATDPDQMIALMRAVYMDQTLPGNKHRGYTSAGEEDGTVVYPAIGKMTGSYDNPVYSDSYGWKIPSKSILTNTTPPDGGEYKYFNPADYEPNEEGLTLLLVELNDGVTSTSGTQSPTSYDGLSSMFKSMFKSVRIVTSFKNSGSGEEAGTLFKIDCDRMNRFFFLGKGRLRLYDNTIDRYTIDDVTSWLSSQSGSYWRKATGSATSYFEQEVGPFYQMFEQFSPVSLSSSAYAEDIYQTLVTGTSYPVEHECESVPWATSNGVTGHEFNLYGRDSHSADCQDVRDLMFFVPEYRMKWWPNTSGIGRDETETERLISDMYINYNLEHMPTMGLFVINQKVIEGEKQDNALKYDLTLSWESNLKTFLPGSEGTYSIYQVVTNADGTKTYELVAENLSSDELTYDLTVDMEKNGRELTFVIRGQDTDGWLTLQYSNERSFYIPGYENKEQLKLAMNIDSYYSRFDPQKVQNNYSNSLTIDNAGTSLLSTYLSDGTDGNAQTVFHIWRVPNGNYDNQVEVATATVTSKETSSGTGTMNLVMDNDTQSEFTYGYHANANEMHPTFSINSNGVVTFSNFSFYDNFSEAIPADNSHPNNYVYYVTFTAATPFPTYNPEGVPDIATWQEGKTFAYFECPSNWDNWDNNDDAVRAYVWAINADDGSETKLTGDWPGNGWMQEPIGKASNGNNIYLWAVEKSSLNVQPTNILFNCGSYQYNTSENQTADFTFVNGGYYNVSGHVGTVSKSSTDATSNTVTVPVYKTAMAMSPISQDAVNNDLLHQTPANTQFTINVQSSARSEILRYDAYRWADSKTNVRDIIEEYVNDQDEEDVDPAGQANNESDHYTTKMNADYTGSVSFADGATTAQAPFEDNYLLLQPTAETYTYAPVVELLHPAGSISPITNVERVDYNTYGAPLQVAASGEMDIVEVEKESSGYTWPADNPTYRYYNVFLKINSDKLIVPAGYEIYKVRIWRNIDSQYLSEQKDKGYEYRLDLDDNGEYLFEDIDKCQPGGSLGSKVLGTSGTGPVYAGTFGAKIVEDKEVIPMKFTVRVYFTKPSSSKAGDQPYYIAETVIEDELTSDVTTSIYGVESSKVVTGIKYYNMSGIESDVPFQGVNIEVTTYDDGSRTTRKILK